MDHSTNSHMVFYFDVDDPASVNQLIPHITKFGGECTNFFSKDVTHLITNKITSKRGEIMVTTLPSGSMASHSTTAASPSAKMSLLCSSINLPATTSRLSTYGSSAFDRLGASPINPSSSYATTTIATPVTDSTIRHHTLSHLARKTTTPTTNDLVYGKENSMAEDLDFGASRSSAPLKVLSTPQGINGAKNDPSSMLQQSRYQQKYDLIHKAKTMNVSIWTVDQLLSYLKRCYENISENIEHISLFSKLFNRNSRKKETDLMNCLLAEKQQGQHRPSTLQIGTTHTGITADSLSIRHSSRLSYNSTSRNILASSSLSHAAQQHQFVQFEHPFILIEDAHGSYKPFFKEFKPARSKSLNVPCLYLNSPQGHCPFIKPSTSATRKQRSEVMICDSLSGRFQEAMKRTRYAISSSVISKWRSEMHAKCSKIKRPGYCECCLERYSDLVEHSRQLQHRKFAMHQDNFIQLDAILSDLRRPMKVQTMSITSCPGTPRSLSPFANPATCHDSLLSASCKRKDRSFTGKRSTSSKRKLLDRLSFVDIEHDNDNNGHICNDIHNDRYDDTPSSPLCQKYSNSRVEKLQVI